MLLWYWQKTLDRPQGGSGSVLQTDALALFSCYPYLDLPTYLSTKVFSMALGAKNHPGLFSFAQTGPE
jgi:hypothetical protein